MRRLFTFGCSFTKYSWPTWADFFGLEFDHFENWGLPGIGNVAIANRVAESLTKNKFTADDTVIVQWSSHIRNDYHTFRAPPFGRNSAGWKTKGSMFNYLNKDLYNKDWQATFFDEQSYIMYSLNSMTLVRSLLDNVGCNWAMTSIGDFSKAGSDMIDPNGFAENVGSKKDIWLGTGFSRSINFESYKDYIDFYNWCEPIGSFAWNRQEKQFHWKAEKDIDSWIDPHPSVELHFEWLDSVLKPKLNLQSSKNDIQNFWLTEVDRIYKTHNQTKDMEQFEMRIANLPHWNRTYIGY